MKWNEFCDKIDAILLSIKGIVNLVINKEEGIITFSINDKTYKYTIDDYEQTIKNKQNNDNEGYIYSDNYYEAMLIETSDDRIPMMHRLDNILGEYDDIENTINYSLGPISDQFIIYNLDNFDNLRGRKPMYMLRYALDRKEVIEQYFDDEKNEVALFSLIRLYFRHNFSLKITTDKKYKIDEFETLSDSFLYNVAYNTNILLKRISETLDNTSLDAFKISRRNYNISAPKRKYVQKLLEQYNTAISSRDPFIQFICYYHIIEHFYEDVYNEALINNLRLELTNPGFSIKNDKNISKLIDIVKKKLKQNKEEFSINELEALELVLKKYVSLDELKSQLNSLEPKCIDYYNNTNVKFCERTKLNFADLKDESNYKNIAKRIYKTRNALVHYKSDDKSTKELKVYSPFNDKKALEKEIPLMRIIAEIIILNNSAII